MCCFGLESKPDLVYYPDLDSTVTVLILQKLIKSHLQCFTDLTDRLTENDSEQPL